MKDHSRTDGLIGDYCDGSFVKSDPYFQANPNALQLLLYFDEVEVCDVLASHRGQHKLGNIVTHGLLVAMYEHALLLRIILLYNR